MKLHLILLLFLLTSFIYAQDLPGKPDSLYSEALKEKVRLQIVLPANYKAGKTYDVLYILDGATVTLIAQTLQVAEESKYVPPVILVGIFHSDRGRDLTPGFNKKIRTSGGAQNLLNFIKNELQPYINKTYRTSGENILYGHSLGGLFVMYALLSEPQLFSSYLAIDPSFWWDNNSIIELASQKLPSLAGLNKILFISGRDDGLSDIRFDRMDSILKAKAPADLHVKASIYENESHNSVRLKSIYDGVKYIYAGFDTKNLTIGYYPANGTILKDKPYLITSWSSEPNIRYTDNGTTPAKQSAKFERENTLTGPAQLNIKSFSLTGKYDKVAKGMFVEGEALPPIANAKDFEPGGLSYAYYEGDWNAVPNFRKLKPLLSGTIDADFTFRKFPSKTKFATVFEGMIEMKEDGYYSFMIDADDGAKLYLKDKLLINYDGVHQTFETQSYLLPLKKGFYPIRLEHFQKEGNYDLVLKYIVPGEKKFKQIPFELQYHKIPKQ